MELQQVWVLRGPNVFARFPVLKAELDLEDLKGRVSNEIPGFNERLLSWLPTLNTRSTDYGRPGSFGQQLRTRTGLAVVFQQVALELQSLAGSTVHFGLVRELAPEGLYRVVVEYEEEAVGRACLDAAREICQAAVSGEPYDPAVRLAALRDLAHEIRLGPSTGAIVRAARQRNIPVRRLNRESLVQLGHGVYQRRICTAETDRTSAIAEAVAQDKQLTRSLLRAAGVPVPSGRPVSGPDDAWEAAEEVGVPVVVKPQFGNHGRGVTTNLTSREQVVRAYAAARQEEPEVVVEQFIHGDDYRMLVIGERLVAAARREPAQVIGNGRATVAELVAEVNRDPRRSDGHATVLSFIKLDAIALTVLAEQGYTPQSVPAAGVRVLIRRNANLSTGGTAVDVTDEVHPDTAARAVDAARAVGLDIAGVDILATDIRQPLESQRGAVCEVNAGPGLRMHLEPSVGKPRPVGEAIVDLLFPERHTGRIPVVAAIGSHGKQITQLIAHLLARPDRVIGMACSDGVYIGDRCIDMRDGSRSDGARMVLLSTRAQAAVLEIDPAGVRWEGLGFDLCDVAVVTDVPTGEFRGPDGSENLEEATRVVRTLVEVVARTGSAVLNADAPRVAALAGNCLGAVVTFAREPSNTVLAAHRKTGGRAVFLHDESIVLAVGEREEGRIPLLQIPLACQGPSATESILAATAAAWALGAPLEQMRAGLASFVAERGRVRDAYHPAATAPV